MNVCVSFCDIYAYDLTVAAACVFSEIEIAECMQTTSQEKNQDVLVHFTTHTQFNFFCQQEGDGCYGNVTMGMPCLSVVSVPCHTHTRAQTLTQQEPRTVRLNKKP